MKQENKVWVVVKEMSVHYDDFFTLQVYSSLELAKETFDLWVEEDLMNYDAEWEVEVDQERLTYSTYLNGEYASNHVNIFIREEIVRNTVEEED